MELSLKHSKRDFDILKNLNEKVEKMKQENE